MTTNPVNLLVLTSPISLGEIVRPIAFKGFSGADAKGSHLFIYPKGLKFLTRRSINYTPSLSQRNNADL